MIQQQVEPYSLVPRPAPFRLHEGKSQGLVSKVMWMRPGIESSRKVIFRAWASTVAVFRYQVEGSESTLLVATLHSLFVPQTYRWNKASGVEKHSCLSNRSLPTHNDVIWSHDFRYQAVHFTFVQLNRARGWERGEWTLVRYDVMGGK